MSYSSEVLADSPLWYARLGEASGTTMVDSSGNGHNGTYSNVTLGATSLLVGDPDTAASFNAVSSECNVPNGSWMNTSSVTYEALIKPNHLSAYHVFMCRDSAGTRGSMFRTTPSAKLEIEFRNNSGTLYTVTGSTTLTTGTVYHVAAVFDSAGGTLKMYLNGVQEGSTVSVTGTAFSNSLPIELGVYAGAGLYWWNGVIDEAAYYGTALSSARIAAHYVAATTAPITVAGTAFASAATFLDGAMPVTVAGTAFASPATMVSGAALTAVRVDGDAFASPLTMLDGFIQGVPIPGEAWHSSAVMLGGGAVVPVSTDTSNALNGRRRGGSATVDVSVPVVPIPAGTTVATKVDKAVPLPLPTLVNGRPT